jgi:hypothetical protein
MKNVGEGKESKALEGAGDSSSTNVTWQLTNGDVGSE